MVLFVIDPTFFDGRCARVVGPGGFEFGTFGVIHPEVLAAFGLTLPVSAIEITVEQLL